MTIAGAHELRPSHGSAARSIAPRRRAASRGRSRDAQREQRRARETRGGDGVGRDRRRGDQRGRRQPRDERGARRPRLGDEAACERGGEHEPQRRDRREEQLDGDRPPSAYAGAMSSGNADPDRVEQAAVRAGRAGPGRRGRSSARPRAVVVAEVEVAVGDDRLGDEQAGPRLQVAAGRVGSPASRRAAKKRARGGARRRRRSSAAARAAPAAATRGRATRRARGR